MALRAPARSPESVLLKISAKSAPKADACVALARRLGVACTASQTWSSVSNDHCWCAEEGVALELHGVSKDCVANRVWPALRDEFRLECAHVTTDHFKGCIWDWLRPTSCPARVRKPPL
jgi:hypothetical protein